MAYLHFIIIASLSITLTGIADELDDDYALKEELFRVAQTNHHKLSYRAARVKLFNEIHLKEENGGSYIEGVYCLDKFPHQRNTQGRIPNHTQFNTEHTWPQSKFSHQFPRGIQKSDLHHLYPTFSRINSERGNYPFAEVNRERDTFCDESGLGKPAQGGGGLYFEPPDEHKGNVARAMFYFSVRYKISIDSIQEAYLRRWHQEDPVDAEEIRRHEKISRIQGNINPFIADPEFVSRIRDF